MADETNTGRQQDTESEDVSGHMAVPLPVIEDDVRGPLPVPEPPPGDKGVPMPIIRDTDEKDEPVTF